MCLLLWYTVSHHSLFCSVGISPFTNQPTSIVVTEGSVARFTCKVTASPPPIITWEFNRVMLPLATKRYAFSLFHYHAMSLTLSVDGV